MTFASGLTNLKIVEERKAVPEGKEELTGRIVLAERPDRNRVFVYVTHVEGRAIFLFVEGPDLTMEDRTARLFIQ